MSSPPSPRVAIDAGSGTTLPRRLKLMLNVGAGVPPTMSVPTLNESGSRFPLRTQAWRSGRNGVPGGTIGSDEEPVEVPVSLNLDLRHEEIMVRRQVERQRQRNVETNFLPGHRTFAARGLIWNRVDPRKDRVIRGERRAQHGRQKAQVSRPGRSRVKGHVRG